MRLSEFGGMTLATDDSLRSFGQKNAMNPDRQLVRVEFADGTVWAREYMHNILIRFDGTDDDEIIEGLVGNDILRGGKGDDTLKGGRGSDVYKWSPSISPAFPFW